MTEPNTGQIYLDKEAKVLYLLADIDIASVNYFTLVNLENGSIGPLYDIAKECVNTTYYELVADDLIDWHHKKIILDG